MPGALRSLSTVVQRDNTSASDIMDQQYVYNVAGYLDTAYDIRGDSYQEYTYNVYGRLNSQVSLDQSGLGKSSFWSYSPGGDIAQIQTVDPHSSSTVLHQYMYNPARGHVLEGIADAAGNITRTFTPDAKGNILARDGANVPNGHQSLTYNEFDLPTVIAGGTGGDTRFEYTAAMARAVKRGPTRTTYYMDELYECDVDPAQGNTGNCLEQRFKIYSGSRQIAVVTRASDQFYTESTRYIHTDHLGSGTVITDDSGNVTERRYYDSFGKVDTASDLGQSPVKAGYTGHEYDAELGLVNMRGRIYDPSIQRFLTPDPFVTDPFNPQGLNRFSYVTNNPLNLIDPSGFAQEGCSDCGGGGYGATGGGGGGGPSGGGGGGGQEGAGSSPDEITVWVYGQRASSSGQSSKQGDSSNGSSERGGTGNMEARGGHGEGPIGGPGGDVQAGANQSWASMTQPVNACGPSYNSTGNNSPSAAGGVQGTSPSGPPGGTSAKGNENIDGNSGNGQGLPTVIDVGPGQTIAYSAVLVVLAPTSIAPLLGGTAAMYRGMAGGVSGFTSGLATGLTPGQALGQGLMNGGLSAVNPVGTLLPGLSSLWQSTLTSGLSSGLNQAANGNMPNWMSMFTAAGMRFGFGIGTGGVSPSDVGSALGIGMANGLFSSSVKSSGGW